MENPAAVGGIVHLPRSGRHKVNGERAALTLRSVGRGVVQGLAVMKHASAGRQVDDNGPIGVHLLFDVQERATGSGLLM